MGSRGPVKVPTRIRQLRGENRPSQINHHEPQPGGEPAMPRDMPAEAKKVWRRLVRDYGHVGVLTAVDADVLRAYCEAVARLNHASVLLQTMGPVVRGARSGELVKNPLHQIVRDNALLVRQLARELGFTPSARTGLTGNEKPAVDPLDSFLRSVG